jgi:Cu+-exporting ATPase
MQVTDPVCGMKLDSEKAAAREVWKGQTYYFCSDLCRQKFQATPERCAKEADRQGRADPSPSR